MESRVNSSFCSASRRGSIQTIVKNYLVSDLIVFIITILTVVCLLFNRMTYLYSRLEVKSQKGSRNHCIAELFHLVLEKFHENNVVHIRHKLVIQRYGSFIIIFWHIW